MHCYFVYAIKDKATTWCPFSTWHFYFVFIERVLVDINFYPGTLAQMKRKMQAGEIGLSSPKTSSQSFGFQPISAFIFSQNVVFFLSIPVVIQHFLKKCFPQIRDFLPRLPLWIRSKFSFHAQIVLKSFWRPCKGQFTGHATNSFPLPTMRTARSRSHPGRQWLCLTDSFKMDSNFSDVKMWKKCAS